MAQLLTLFDNFTLSWDLGVIIFLFFAAFFYGFSVGARRIGSLLVSVYFAYLLITLAPTLEKFLGGMADYQRLIFSLAIFAALVFGLFFLLSGSILRSSLSLPKKEDGQWWHFFALGIVTAGFFSASVLSLLPEDYYGKLSTITKTIFVLNYAHFWWAVAGIVVFIILRKTKKQ